MKKYIVKLSQEEREALTKLISQGKRSARKILHAQVLLKADSGKYGEFWTDREITEAFPVSIRSVERIRARFVEESLEAALNRRQQKRTRRRVLDGDGEAKLIRLACSKAPAGRSRWTLELLADRMVRLKYVDTISSETVRRTLKKTKLSPG